MHPFVVERDWSFPLAGQGVGGVAAGEDLLVVSGRDAADREDTFVVLDPSTGLLIDEFAYDAPGQLDYGSSPRATPLIAGEYVYTLGAFGHLCCFDPLEGEVVWSKHLVDDLGGRLPTWGYCSSPVLAGDRLIVQPGGPAASIAALDAATGELLWTTPGGPAAYASPLVVDDPSGRFIAGFDERSLGIWSAEDGRRLWTHEPEVKGDFHVPSPLMVDGKLAAASENNGVRLFAPPAELIADGISEPIARSESLRGDTHTPVVMGRYLIGVDGDLVVLDAGDGLREVARWSDRELDQYAAIFVHGDRLLVHLSRGTLVALKFADGKLVEYARGVTELSSSENLSHPAFADGVLYLRTPGRIAAYRLASP